MVATPLLTPPMAPGAPVAAPPLLVFPEPVRTPVAALPLPVRLMFGAVDLVERVSVTTGTVAATPLLRPNAMMVVKLENVRMIPTPSTGRVGVVAWGRSVMRLTLAGPRTFVTAPPLPAPLGNLSGVKSSA